MELWARGFGTKGLQNKRNPRTGAWLFSSGMTDASESPEWGLDHAGGKYCCVNLFRVALHEAPPCARIPLSTTGSNEKSQLGITKLAFQ